MHVCEQDKFKWNLKNEIEIIKYEKKVKMGKVWLIYLNL